MSEKEANDYLFDHLHSLKRIRKLANSRGDEEVVELVDEEISNVTDKLYQKPPLSSE